VESARGRAPPRRRPGPGRARDVAGVFDGVAAAAVLIVGILRLTSDFPAAHARKAAQAPFAAPGAHVGRCTKASDGDATPVLRCRVTTARCARQFRFALDHEFGSEASLDDARLVVLCDPCRFRSD
jgi:hypothetical protein